VYFTNTGKTRFSSHTLGISSVHSNPNPENWSGPHGQNVYTPTVNCLCVLFRDVVSGNDLVAQYERVVNCCMIHKCRAKYCNKPGKPECRFHFPMDMHGFEQVVGPEGQAWYGIAKVDTTSDVGNKLVHLCNYPTVGRQEFFPFSLFQNALEIYPNISC